MTDGHKHREVNVKVNGLIIKTLTKPIPFFYLSYKHLERVQKSPYPYKVKLYGEFITGREEPDPDEIYVLSWLGFLHRWTGLVLKPTTKGYK